MWTEKNHIAVLSEIGNRIRMRRFQMNLTQDEIASIAGVSPLTVFNLEKGNSVSLSNFIRVLRALGLLDNLSLLLPDTQLTPQQKFLYRTETRQRVKHRKEDDR